MKKYFRIILEGEQNEYPEAPQNSYICEFRTEVPIPPALVPLWLFRNWDANKKCPVEKGFAVLWRDSQMLDVAAFFQDSNIFSEAKGKNDKTWKKGDTLEFFFQPVEEKRYFELHLTPSNATLELAIPDRDKLLNNEYSFESLFCDTNMQVQTGFIIGGESILGWWGHIKVPFDKIGINGKKGLQGRFSVCRYNYNQSWGKTPECSSSSPLTAFSFHRPHEWQELIFL